MASQPDPSPPPIRGRHVLMIITGGTICMQDSPDGLVPTSNFAHNLLVPSRDFHNGTPPTSTPVINEDAQLVDVTTLNSPSQTGLTAEYRCSVLEFQELIDSSSMDGTHWNNIAKTVQMNLDRFDAFVILHGTDTLAYTASILSFMLGPTSKSIIVTGSQVSMYAPDNDAHDNLLDSLTFAATFDLPEPGVVFHHHLYRATRVTKVSAFSMAAFTTPNAKPLATVRKDANAPWTPVLHSESIRLAGTTSRLGTPTHRDSKANVLPTLNTDQVAVLKMYPGISMSMISYIVNMPNLRGLVLETFGAGNVPIAKGGPNLLEVLASAVHSGIVVVSVTQCLTGSVTTAYESARRMERCGIVTGLDMTTEAAYTKLVYLLAQKALVPHQIASKMREDLRGELTADFREEQRRRDSVSRTSRPDVAATAR